MSARTKGTMSLHATVAAIEIMKVVTVGHESEKSVDEIAAEIDREIETGSADGDNTGACTRRQKELD